MRKGFEANKKAKGFPAKCFKADQNVSNVQLLEFE